MYIYIYINIYIYIYIQVSDTYTIVLTGIHIVTFWDPRMHHKILIHLICSLEGLMMTQ